MTGSSLVACNLSLVIGLLRSDGNGIRRRVCAAVGDGDEHLFDAEFLAQFAGRSAERDSGPAAHLIADLDVAPLDATGPAGAQGFEHRLFGRETAGIVLRR